MDDGAAARAERLAAFARAKDAAKKRARTVRRRAARAAEWVEPPNCQLNKDHAAIFVAMTEAGIPAATTLHYIGGPVWEGWSAGQRRDTILLWQRSKEVRDAQAAVHGATWIAMPAERRVQVALDKHHAQLAHFLFTHPYDTLTDLELKKADTAREALTAVIAAKTGDAETPLVRMLRDLVEGRLVSGPARLPLAPGVQPAGLAVGTALAKAKGES